MFESERSIHTAIYYIFRYRNSPQLYAHALPPTAELGKKLSGEETDIMTFQFRYYEA